MNVGAVVAREHGRRVKQVFTSRRLRTVAIGAGEELCPPPNTDLRSTTSGKLHRLLGKKTLENEICAAYCT